MTEIILDNRTSRLLDALAGKLLRTSVLMVTVFFLSSCGGSASEVSVIQSSSGGSAPTPVPPPAGQAEILARQYVTSTIHIPGGNYATPYICSQANTEYILDNDIVASGTAILIRASKVVLNLNGKTIVYNQTTPGEGVYIDTYNKTDICITNGSIIQGAALSEGDVYGQGNNPVRSVGTERLQIALVYARYGGRDVGGFYLSAGNSIIEQNILEDVWTVGTLKNRQQGIDAITTKNGGNNIYRYNTIKNCRQRGINVTGTNDVAYGNTISINSLATNSFGIFGYAAKHVKVYNNTITGKGEHPIGIGYVSAGTDDIQIYNNTIDVQTTRIGQEYGGSAACFNPATPCGNYAVGFRTTWGGNNINFHDNTITVRTDSRYQGTYSPTGAEVVVNGKGRGLMVELITGEKALFSNNTITASDKDGSGKAFGIACTGGNLSPDMVFSGNTVTSNILNVALGDEYGACGGYPLFIRNTFVKADNYPAYTTVAAELSGYNEATGRFVSNAYQNGASIANMNLYFNSTYKKPKSVYLGREIAATVQNAPSLTPLAAAILTVNNGGAPFDSTATTASDGTAKIIVYDYEQHNGNGAIPAGATRYLAPHTVSLNAASTLYSTQSDSSPGAWDALTSTGSYTPGLYLDGILDETKKLTLSY